MPLPEKITTEYQFILKMEVRDYELDTEKIVNNANYLHYMEHTRHKFCESAGISFIEMLNQGIVSVVRKIEIEYIFPLKSGQKFYSCLNIRRKGPRFIFNQVIYNEEAEIVAKAEITIVSLINGILSRGDELGELFSDYIKH